MVDLPVWESNFENLGVRRRGLGGDLGRRWSLEMRLKESGRRMVCFGWRVQGRDGEILKRMVAMLVGCWGS